MTLENAKKLYQHFVERGMKEEAANIKVNIDKKGGSVSTPQKEKPVASKKKA